MKEEGTACMRSHRQGPWTGNGEMEDRCWKAGRGAGVHLVGREEAPEKCEQVRDQPALCFMETQLQIRGERDCIWALAEGHSSEVITEI